MKGMRRPAQVLVKQLGSGFVFYDSLLTYGRLWCLLSEFMQKR